MTLKTNLNSAPYYDDFDSSDNFHRVLFRPGYAIQARELTQLQSILQDQIEKHGTHIFKDGAVVVPGQVSFSNQYMSVRLKSTFSGESIDPAQYYNSNDLVLLTGETSGVTAEVIGYSRAGEDAAEPLLYIKYVSTGTSGSADILSEDNSIFFQDGENLFADIEVTHTTPYSAGSNSLTVLEAASGESASSYGSAVQVDAGVFYVKGTFVETTAQTLVISYNNAFPTAVVGFKIVEEIITPEADTTLLDNATGTSNYAAKGAHRLKLTLTLDTKTLDESTDNADFVELIRIVEGQTITKTKDTMYNILGDALAKRTSEESGDYVVKPHRSNITETVDNFRGTELNLGSYEAGTKTDDYINAQNDFLTLHIQPGISYINGYRHENIGQVRKEILKARDTKTIDAGQTDFEIGNYFRLTNVYGSPDIGEVSGETTAYRPILLWDSVQSERGTIGAANAVGVLRPRAFEHEADGTADGGTAGVKSTNTDGIYRLYAFDVRNFTQLQMSDTPSPTTISNFATGGVQVKGVTSGATGFVFNDTTTFPDTTFTASKNIYLTNVIGDFQTGEKVTTSDSIETSSILENSSNTDLTISNIITSRLTDAASVQMQESDSGQQFAADIVLDVLDPSDQSFLVLEASNLFSVGGYNIALEDGTDNATGTLQLEKLAGARLRSPQKLQSIFKMPKDTIKTLLTDDNNNVSQTELTFRKQFVGTTSAAGVVAFTAGSGETFVDFAEKDYTVSILTAGGGTGSQGDIVSISGKTGGHNTATLTITDNTVFGASAKVKVIATVKKSAVTSPPKTTNLSKQLKVLQQGENAAGAYGTRAQDKEISLGRTDVYRIQAIYDSQTNSTDAVAPTLTVSDISGTFERGERIKGNTSGARGRLITTSSPMSFTQTFGEGSTPFQDGETFTGQYSGATATIDTDGITSGDFIVTNNFNFDDGQKNNYYDIARLVRKPGAATPTGRLLVIYDYLSHGSGNFFSVDSYNSVSGQMDYDDIPMFIAATTDPDDPTPTDTFPLADSLDFRPTVENIAGTSETLTAVDQVTGNSFDTAARQYDGTGAIVVDTPKPDSTITLDFEFYLPKVICLYMTENGEFEVVESEPNEIPSYPAQLTNAMKLADFLLPAYTFSPRDVDIVYQDNSRYTMRDIGKLERRIDNLEYYTSLTLLENQTNSMEILDTHGLNRFKSGFVVDPFTGHDVGAQRNPDYHCAIDTSRRELRPRTVDKNIGLKLLLTNTSEQKAAGFQKTGSLVTLPYTEQTLLNNSFKIITEEPPPPPPPPPLDYVGKFTVLDPHEDNWFETETTILEPIYDTTAYDASMKNSDGSQINTPIYGSWNDVGEPYGKHSRWFQNPITGMIINGKWLGVYGHGVGGPGQTVFLIAGHEYKQKMVRTKTVKNLSYTDDSQTSIRTGKTSSIKFCRPKTLKFTITGLKPNTNHFPFFNKEKVGKYSGPLAKQYAQIQSNWTDTSYADVDTGDSVDITPARPSPNQSAGMRTNDIGELKGFFMIPDHRGKNNSDVPKFVTGTSDFSVSSNENNEMTVVQSRATTQYHAAGVLNEQTSQVITTKVPGTITSSTTTETKVADRSYRWINYPNIWSNGFTPTGQWQTYDVNIIRNPALGGQMKFIPIPVDSYVEKGILQKRGNVGAGTLQLRIHPGYRVGSPGEYEKETAGSKDLAASAVGPFYQTFYVDKDHGYFVTSLNLYFRKKSKVDPVTISIVTTKNGVPGTIELPYSAVTLSSDEVNEDETGETFTTVTLPSPVYLTGGEKYAIRIMSKGDSYKVKLGQDSIGEKKNPALDAVFFASNRIEDGGTHDYHMRFNLNTALFENATDGKVTMRNAFAGELMTLENGGFAYAKRLIISNPIELTNSITKVKVNHINHGMYSTSNNVQISGVKSGVTTTLNGSITALGTKLVLKSFAGFSSGSTHAGSGAIRVKIDNELFSGTLSGNTLTVSGRGTVGYGSTSGESVQHSDGATVELYMLFGVPLNQINNTHTAIADIEMDSYTVSITTAPTITGGSTTLQAGGTDVFASENYRYELFKTYVPTVEVLGTAISAKVRQTTGTSPGGSETSFDTTTEANAFPIALNQEYPLEKTAIIASPPNETNEMNSSRSFFLDLIFKSDNSYLSPVLDLTDPAVICIGNRLDNIDSSSDVYTPSGSTTNYKAHTEPVGDSNTAAYLTKPVQLENTATGLKLFLDVHKPPTSEVKAMFRVLPAEGEDDIQTIPFTFFNADATAGDGLPDSGVATNAQDQQNFVEYKYTAGINDDGNGEVLQDFQQFQIKLVMQGTNAAAPPRIMNLRAIALAT